MSETAAPKGPYTLWQYVGYENWTFTDFATLQEAAEAERYGGPCHISKPVNVAEATDSASQTAAP